MISPGVVTDGKIASNANILDTKLAQIVTPEKVANSATSATSNNTPNSIMLRGGDREVRVGQIISDNTVGRQGLRIMTQTTSDSNTIAMGRGEDVDLEIGVAGVSNNILTGSSPGDICIVNNSSSNKILMGGPSSPRLGISNTLISAVGGAKFEGDLNGVATNVVDNAINTNKIANTAVTTAKLADTAVTTAKIAISAVGQEQLSDDSVNTNKLVNNAVTTVKINNNAVTTDKILNGNITTAKIADGNITTAKINTGAVTEGKIQSGAVTTSILGASSVTNEKIADNSITNSKIITGAIQNNKLATATHLNNDGSIVVRSHTQPTYMPSLTIEGNLSFSGYRNISMSGGNSIGSLYGSFAALGDSIHIGYNYYARNDGTPIISNTGGATSRITAGYGKVSLCTGEMNTAPTEYLKVEGGQINATNGAKFNGNLNGPGGSNVGWITTTAGLGGGGAGHYFMSNSGTNRWGIGIHQAESSGNIGSDFIIWRYGNNGEYLNSALEINRSSGATTIRGDTSIIGYASCSETFSTKGLAVNAGGSAGLPLTVRSGHANANLAVGIGCTGNELELCVASANGHYASGEFPSVAGDVIIRNSNTGNTAILFSVGGIGKAKINSNGLQTTTLSATSAAQGALKVMSGASGSPTSMQLGRDAVDVDLKVVGVAGSCPTIRSRGHSSSTPITRLKRYTSPSMGSQKYRFSVT